MNSITINLRKVRFEEHVIGCYRSIFNAQILIWNRSQANRSMLSYAGLWYYIILHFSFQRITNYFTNYIHSLPNHLKATADGDKLNPYQELAEEM